MKKIFRLTTLTVAILVIACAVIALSACTDHGGHTDSETAQTYTVLYLDGENVVFERQVAEGKCAENLFPGNKEGYAFDGWLYDGDKFSFTTLITSNLTLTATWNSVTVAAEHRVVFIADGAIVSVVYCGSYEKVTPPVVPPKTGYSGEWGQYSEDGENFTVKAVYTPIEYTVRFIVDGEVYFTAQYNVENKNIRLPELPQKRGYTASWESFALTYGDKDVHAIYELETYKIKFYTDGGLIAEREYDAENRDADLPDVPHKEGFTGEWEYFELDCGDIEVNAVYKPVESENSPLNEAEEPFVPDDSGESDEPDEPVVPDAPIELDSPNEFDESDEPVHENPVQPENPDEPDIPPYESDLIYELIGDYYAVIGVNGHESNIYIPATYDGLPVMKIGAGAFIGNTDITSVTVAKGVIEIGEAAFQGCENLYEILLPTGLHTIGDYAFMACAIPEITLPDGLTEIGKYAFAYCFYLRNVIIPDGVTKLGDGAFMYCDGIESITFGKGLIYIGRNCFYGCRFTAATFADPSDWKRAEDKSGLNAVDAYYEFSDPRQAAEALIFGTSFYFMKG